MSLRLFPSETRSLDLLTSLAAALRDAITTDAELLGAAEEDRRTLASRLTSLETRADDLHYALLTHLRSSFVNPLPREDLYEFSRQLHSAVSFVVAAGPTLQPAHDSAGAGAGADDPVPELLEIMSRQVDLARQALAGLGKLESIEDTWLDLVRLDARSRRAHRTWMLHLADLPKASTALARQVPAAELGRAAAALRGFADQLGHVLVKES